MKTALITISAMFALIGLALIIISGPSVWVALSGLCSLIFLLLKRNLESISLKFIKWSIKESHHENFVIFNSMRADELQGLGFVLYGKNTIMANRIISISKLFRVITYKIDGDPKNTKKLKSTFIRYSSKIFFLVKSYCENYEYSTVESRVPIEHQISSICDSLQVVLNYYSDSELHKLEATSRTLDDMFSLDIPKNENVRVLTK